MRKTWKKRLVTAIAGLAVAGAVFAGQVNGVKAAGDFQSHINCWVVDPNANFDGDGDNPTVTIDGGVVTQGSITAHFGPFQDPDWVDGPVVDEGELHIKVDIVEINEVFCDAYEGELPTSANYSFEYDGNEYHGTVPVELDRYGSLSGEVTENLEASTENDDDSASKDDSSSSKKDSAAADSSSSNSTHHAHVHHMVMTVITPATETSDGLMALKCDGSKCSYVDHSTDVVIPRQSVTANKNMQLITNAKAGEPIVLDTKDSYSFNQYVIAELMKHPECPVTWNFTYENKSYTMTVPAGTDWTAALNDNGWAGFKNVAALNGVSLVENSK